MLQTSYLLFLLNWMAGLGVQLQLDLYRYQLDLSDLSRAP